MSAVEATFAFLMIAAMVLVSLAGAAALTMRAYRYVLEQLEAINAHKQHGERLGPRHRY